MSEYSCLTLGTHEIIPCNDFAKGGISALALLLPGHGITSYSNATQWNTAISAGSARVIKNIKAEMPRPSTQKGENPVPCGPEQITDGFNYSIKTKDFNVQGTNDAFWLQANNVDNATLVMYLCNEDQIRVVAKVVNTDSALVIPVGNKDKQYYDVEFTWYQDVKTAIPTLGDAPANIFV